MVGTKAENLAAKVRLTALYQHILYSKSDVGRESDAPPAFRLPPQDSFHLQPPHGIICRPLQVINMAS
jgi:hypothetical protein